MGGASRQVVCARAGTCASAPLGGATRRRSTRVRQPMGARHLSLGKTHEAKEERASHMSHHLPPFKEKKRDFYFISHAHMLPFALPHSARYSSPRFVTASSCAPLYCVHRYCEHARRFRDRARRCAELGELNEELRWLRHSLAVCPQDDAAWYDPPRPPLLTSPPVSPPQPPPSTPPPSPPPPPPPRQV